MTSPTNLPKPSLLERVSTRLTLGRSTRASDPEERFTRNVTVGFVALIVGVALVIVIGLAYGFWDSNLRPLANVDGSEVSRGMYQDRVALETFRLDRAETAVRSGLVDGSVHEDLANRRLNHISDRLGTVTSTTLDDLVDLLYQEKLAAQEGVTLADDELAAALAADGTAPEARRVSALTIRSDEEAIGLAPTAEGRAAARAKAEDALAELRAGTPFADVAADVTPEATNGGDLGYVERDDISDGYLADVVFGLDEGAISDIVEGQSGELLILEVTDIVPPQPDSGFLNAVNETIGEDVHTRNVQLEALAAKLEDRVVADTLAAHVDQVELAEILIQGDPLADPATDEGTIRASHILYTPGDDPNAVPADDDPAWAEAEAEAQLAADQLRAVADPASRAEDFARRAMKDGDDPTAPTGGDLGYFDRASMVPEFADALFDHPDLAFGDIVGPVRSQFGWHVILFQDRRPPLAERVSEVQAALGAAGADFAMVAREHSDGPEAADGGYTGWHVLDDLDDLSAMELASVDVGGVTEPVEGDLGFTIYQKLDEEARPRDAEAAARLRPTVFDDWYAERFSEAQDEGRISVDDSVGQG